MHATIHTLAYVVYLKDWSVDLLTVLLHNTALRGNRWELNIPKPFLKTGAFHLQQIQTISTAKLERRPGTLTEGEMKTVEEALMKRLAPRLK
jgi:mRNA-degrading endonuclease toxin of MazEF toxin-antitoxin module